MVGANGTAMAFDNCNRACGTDLELLDGNVRLLNSIQYCDPQSVGATIMTFNRLGQHLQRDARGLFSTSHPSTSVCHGKDSRFIVDTPQNQTC